MKERFLRVTALALLIGSAGFLLASPVLLLLALSGFQFSVVGILLIALGTGLSLAVGICSTQDLLDGKTIMHMAVILMALSFALAGPVAAQDDGSAPRLPDGPGFAIGTYTNGYAYALAQTFTLRHGGTFDGAVVAFAETTGAPCGAVRWEIRRWWAEYGVMGRMLATGAWEPAEMHFNTLPSAGAKLRPGSYALVLRSVSEQEPGNYWNVIASDGTRDIYAGGELLQLQEDGGAWGSWDGQDIIGELALVGPDTLFVELVG